MPSEYLLTNARLWTHEYFDVLDVPVEHVDVRWDRRFKKRIAMAYLTETEARIRLSTFLYPRLLPRQRVEVIAHEVKTREGVIIPDNARKREDRAEVLANGPGKVNEQGYRIEPQVKRGDIVIFNAYQIDMVLATGSMAIAEGTPVANVGDRFLINEDNIRAVVER